MIRWQNGEQTNEFAEKAKRLLLIDIYNCKCVVYSKSIDKEIDKDICIFYPPSPPPSNPLFFHISPYEEKIGGEKD